MLQNIMRMISKMCWQERWTDSFILLIASWVHVHGTRSDKRTFLQNNWNSQTYFTRPLLFSNRTSSSSVTRRQWINRRIQSIPQNLKWVAGSSCLAFSRVSRNHKILWCIRKARSPSGGKYPTFSCNHSRNNSVFFFCLLIFLVIFKNFILLSISPRSVLLGC